MDRNVIYAFQFRTLVSFFFFWMKLNVKKGRKLEGRGRRGWGVGCVLTHDAGEGASGGGSGTLCPSEV